MRDTARSTSRAATRGGPTRTGALAILLPALLLAALLLASPARAGGLEPAGHFAGSPEARTEEEIEEDEEVQLGGVGGMAVNRTGAGGVPAGTVYAMAKFSVSGFGVKMFEPSEATGRLEFAVAWEFEFQANEETREAEGKPPYERCGPLLGTEEVGGEEVAEHPCAPTLGGNAAHIDVVVDQNTGNVYAMAELGSFGAGAKYIVEYSADGSEKITRFGELAPGSDLVGESPEKLHGSLGPPGGLAINEAGWVYVYDSAGTGFENHHRLAVFEPASPGDYSEYQYAGEVAGGNVFEGPGPARPVADEAGNIYVAGPGGTSVEEYSAAEAVPGPYPHASTPSCSFTFKKGGIEGFTVDPASGEPYFASYKTPEYLHELGPCEAGRFEETGKVEIEPVLGEEAALSALAFAPEQRATPGRRPGVLYGGIASPGVGYLTDYSALGYVFAGPAEEPHPAVVGGESVSHVTTTTALAHATVNPEGNPTAYRFQYETAAAYEANPPGERFAGAAEAPPGGAVAGEGKEAVPVSASLTGLAPGTAYRYRVLAESRCHPGAPEVECPVPGEARSFRSFPVEASGLPDGRAWELVSPAQKHGGQVYAADSSVASCTWQECKPGSHGGDSFPLQSSADGEAVAYEGSTFSTEEGTAFANQYVSRRSATGWRTERPTPSLMFGTGADGYRALDPGLTRAVISQGYKATLAPGAPAGYPDLYSQPLGAPSSLTPLLTAPPPDRAAGSGGFGSNFKLTYAGASADLSRIFFQANDALTPETPYAPAPPDPGVGGKQLYEWHEGALALVNVEPGNGEVLEGASFDPGGAGAVSRDGSRAFFSAPSGQVYVREAGVRTVKLTDPGSFIAAGPDGSKVLLDDGCLYDLASESCTDLTAGKGGFEGLAGAGEGLSRIYFVDSEVLAENAGAGLDSEGEPQHAEAGGHNLYVWQGGATSFVATLLASDGAGGHSAAIHDWAAVPSERTAESSPSGRYLAFVSHAPLTGYDNEGPCGVGPYDVELHEYSVVPGPCGEVFLYDSATGQLACPSCNRSEEAPIGASTLRLFATAPPSLAQPRYLLGNGRLYFDSRDSLVPADTNEGVEDVYQYEPGGLGSCASAQGCVKLISAGTGTVDSNLLAVDETGRNVFFTTRDRLVAKDSDELQDLYDAREGGGIAAESETQRAECQGEACQASGEAPGAPQLSSASYHGAGNLTQRPTGKSNRCKPPARRAQKLSRRARKLRRNAKKVGRLDARRAHRMRRKAARFARQAKRQSRQSRRCRARARNDRRARR